MKVRRTAIIHHALSLSMECKKSQSVNSFNYCLKCYRCVEPGSKKKVSLIDKKTGEIAHSITLGINKFLVITLLILFGDYD